MDPSFAARLISREEAHKQGLTRYFTGMPCKSEHVCERYVSTGGCVDCLNKYRDKYTRHSPTSELTRWKPTEAFLIPVGLTSQQQSHLSACMQAWVIQWAQQTGVALTENQLNVLNKLVQKQLVSAR